MMNKVLTFTLVLLCCLGMQAQEFFSLNFFVFAFVSVSLQQVIKKKFNLNKRNVQ